MTASWILALGVIFPGLDHKFSDKTVKFLEMMRKHWMFGGVPMISNKFRSSSKLGRKRQPLERKEGLRCPTAKKGNHSPQAEKRGLATCNSTPTKASPRQTRAENEKDHTLSETGSVHGSPLKWLISECSEADWIIKPLLRSDLI